jgi:hypothetical protein
MAIVRHEGGRELTLKQQAAMKTEIKAAALRSYVEDPDCPLLTENCTGLHERSPDAE